MILNPAARVRILSGGQYTMRLRSLHRAYPSLHPFGVVHWVPEQLNIKAVTGACKLIDGCSLALCSATGSVVSSGICHRNKVNWTAWLYRDGPSHKIVSFTLHYITMHLMMFGLFRCGHDVTLGCHASYGRRHVVPSAVSLAYVVNGEDGSRRCVSVARSHRPAKPAFCRYRQGKLVLIIKQ